MLPATRFVLGLSLVVSTVAAAQPAAPTAAAPRMEAGQLVTPFSSAKPGAALPAGWEPLTFGSLKTPTEYRFVDDGGTVVVKARAESAASGYNFPVKFDVTSSPFIEFKWKIGSLIEGADNSIASKEDSPVRIVLGFEGDKSKLTLRERTASLLAKRATGRDLPYAQLIYVWSNKAPVGTVIENPHTGRVRMVVAVSGGAQVGKWVTLTRNVVEDFQKAFGESPGLMTDVGIMTDTDNTGTNVDAWYGDIRFLSAKP